MIHHKGFRDFEIGSKISHSLNLSINLFSTCRYHSPRLLLSSFISQIEQGESCGKVEKKRESLSKRTGAPDRRLQFSYIGRAIKYRSSYEPVIFRAAPLTDLTCAFTLFSPSFVSLYDLPSVDFVSRDIWESGQSPTISRVVGGSSSMFRVLLGSLWCDRPNSNLNF